TAPVEEGEDHLADRAVDEWNRRTGLRIDQFQQAVVLGHEVHAVAGFGGTPARDAVERVPPAGVVEDAGAEAFGERPPDFRIAAAALAGAEEPAQPELGRGPAGEPGGLLDQVLAERRRGNDRVRTGDARDLEH